MIMMLSGIVHHILLIILTLVEESRDRDIGLISALKSPFILGWSNELHELTNKSVENGNEIMI